MKYCRILMCVVLGMYSIQSFAGLLIEPVLGYNFVGTLGVNAGKDYKSGGGLGYGGRLGFQTGGFQMGADYLASTIDMNSGDFDRSLETKETGAFLGYEFPAFFRVYGAYILSAEGKTKLNSASRDFKSGDGFKIGLGATILPFVDINLDYRKLNFKNADFDAVMLSLSLPLNLF